MSNNHDPLHVFRFRVDFYGSNANTKDSSGKKLLCSGKFSECSGLEATMEPKSIKEGGHNYGERQRAGRVNFSTVILKRGVSLCGDLWDWFKTVADGEYTNRYNVTVSLIDMGSDPNGTGIITWEMERALPTKFKTADFNAKASEIGIEELHFVHEGFTTSREKQ